MDEYRFGYSFIHCRALLAGITIPVKKSWDFFNSISKQGCDFGYSK